MGSARSGRHNVPRQQSHPWYTLPEKCCQTRVPAARRVCYAWKRGRNPEISSFTFLSFGHTAWVPAMCHTHIIVGIGDTAPSSLSASNLWPGRENSLVTDIHTPSPVLSMDRGRGADTVLGVLLKGLVDLCMTDQSLVPKSELELLVTKWTSLNNSISRLPFTGFETFLKKLAEGKSFWAAP